MIRKENKHVWNIFACVSDHIHNVGTQSTNIKENFDQNRLCYFKSTVDKIIYMKQLVTGKESSVVSIKITS